MQIFEDFGVSAFGKLGHVALSLVGGGIFVKGLEQPTCEYGPEREWNIEPHKAFRRAL
jgi:hypothetical protein